MGLVGQTSADVIVCLTLSPLVVVGGPRSFSSGFLAHPSGYSTLPALKNITHVLNHHHITEISLRLSAITREPFALLPVLCTTTVSLSTSVKHNALLTFLHTILYQ